jgi:dihydrofolate synthase/folylpolyglutamate synthase
MPRGLSASALHAVLTATLPLAAVDTHVDVAAALAAAQASAVKGECILAFGSFFVASAVLAIHAG